MTGVFISWSKGHGRTSDLAQVLGLRPEFVFCPGRGGLLGRYLRQWRATRTILVKEKPDLVWVQLPPAVALTSFWGIRNYRPKIVADLHTGFFLNPIWRWATALSLLWLKRRKSFVVVTNDYLKNESERAGLRAYIVHDIINEGYQLPPEGHILCPLSYANDEPVTAIIGAATLTPEISWVFTGNAPDKVKKIAPPNVRFTGYIEREKYVDLLRTASLVCALTNRPHTMQRAGYEALEYAIPLITSDFPELKTFFRDGAIYSSSDSVDLARKCRTMKKNRDKFHRQMLEIQKKIIFEQKIMITTLSKEL